MSPWAVLWSLLAAFGLAYIVGHSKISLSFRLLLGGRPADDPTQYSPPARPEILPLIPVAGPWLVDLLECPACFGFWEGFIGSFVLGQAFEAAVLAGCAVAGSNFILGRATRLI